MIIDKELVFSNTELVTVDAASETVINNVKPGGMYDNLWLYVKVGPLAMNSTVSIDFKLETSDDNFNADTTVLYSKSFLKAAMTANAELIKVRVPLGVKQYLRMYYDVTTTEDAGSIYAALVPDVNEGF